MMLRIQATIPSGREQYEQDLWVHKECYRFYATKRRLNCNYTQIMDLWLTVPYCVECAASDSFQRYREPDIDSSNWEMDLLSTVGPGALARIQEVLSADSGFFLICKRCGRELRPWEDDPVHVVAYHLEEHYGIPLYTPGKKEPSKKLKNTIIGLYGRRCFNCDTFDVPLYIDHIMPQSKGGDSAFRNLQPLCATCGNAKGDQAPTTFEVFENIYFGPYPLDSVDSLFW